MIKIIADSTCDLSKELLEKYNIDILPLHVHLGENEFQDGKTITPDEIYKWADENNSTPKTSAMSLVECIDSFEKYLKSYNEIICFSISDDMSSTGSVMRMAVDELEANDRIHIVNSKNLSTGIGLLIIEAAIMVQNGNECSEILETIEELKNKVKSSFVVDTLVYLHRGGRCSSVAALMGGVLKLHPRIVVAEGAMSADKKYRGKMDKVILDYVKDMEDALLAADKERVMITHSGCANEMIDKVYSYLKDLNYFDEILITRAGGVISSHCGPGTLGVLYVGK